MIDVILIIIKMIIAILPFVLLCFKSNKLNIDKTERSKQFIMPIIAVIYSIIAMFLMNSINKWLLWVIHNLPIWIASISYYLPEIIGMFFIKLSNLIDNIIKSINIQFWIFFISNTFIIFVYLIIKKISINIIGKIFEKDSDFHDKIASNFYEYFSEKSKWCLKDSYVQARSLLKFFYYTSVIFSIIIMFISRNFYHDELIKTVFYPVFGIIIMGEIYFYLDGATRNEYTQDILGEDEDAYKVVNYSLLRKFLRNLFGDKLLSENTSINNTNYNDITNDEIIKELEKNEDINIVNYAGFIKALNETGADLDQNYIHSAIDLLNGKSILFNNPFYYDLIPYAFYPINKVLLSHKKILVILGRHAIEDEVKQWISEGISAITNIPFMWNIDILDTEKKIDQDTDIGIITRSDVLNIKMHNANAEFLENVSFVVIIEPSKLISTAQIGLNLITKKCLGEQDKKITYCLCDKNCDGLVDAMSHILMTSITEVAATKKHMGTSSYMSWEADDEYLHHRIVPNISRYLGMGTEISYAALKNQVSKTQWYGGESFPVIDMRWIDKQYYYDLMKYAGLPTSQEVMDEKFYTSASLWSAKINKHNYFTVEDESFNMFEIIRNFATRSKEQGFINVISSNYILKDYMAENAAIFETDAKAIPNIVADYVRSNRNTILRLILMMSTFPVDVEILKRELTLIGIKVYDIRKQLWYEIYKCYADVASLNELSDDYKTAVNEVSKLALKKNKNVTKEIDISLLIEGDFYNNKLGKIEHSFLINDAEFLDGCVFELKSAGYVAEDEKGDKYYLGSELSGHIYQKYLPGQFFTFGGKYYEMRYLTADNQVLVRRAADHITERQTYRQIREYAISGIKESEKIGSKQDVSGMKIIHEYADITVNTYGYFKMKSYNDFVTAKEVLFEGEKSGIPHRRYYNKEILRIELPEGDANSFDKVKYTITTLLNEIFKTIFAENHPYIVAVTDNSFSEKSKEFSPLTYLLKGEGLELDSKSIYIIEDSQLDLGLMVAVERNWQRILEIINDYLDWHSSALEDSLNPPPETVVPIAFEEPESEPEEEEKKGIISKIVDKIKSIFKRKKTKTNKEKNVEDDKATEEISQPQEDETENKKEKPEDITEVPEKEDDKVVSEKEEVSLVEAPGDDLIDIKTGDAVTQSDFEFIRKKYHERYYLLYGNDTEPENIAINETLDYLNKLGLGNNPLKQARNGRNIAQMIEETFVPGKTNARYCDFCGIEIYGVEYETLSDGRDRCINCSRTAVKTGDEFRVIFEDVKRNLESFFGIKINVGIKVEMVNSKKLHKKLGKAFIPTPNADGRILGVAIKDKSGYSLLLENGSPRMASMLTIAHELTHIWQYINWNDKNICKKYGKKLRLEVYEGMAKWVEIQYAYLINEPATAKREEIITSYRNDEYGRGFLRYMANYPFSTGTVITKETPFMNIDTPLDLQYCGPISYTPATPQAPTSGTGERKPIKGSKERNVSKLKYFAYETLSAEEKRVYTLLYDAVKTFKNEIPSIGVKVSTEQAKKIIKFVQIDHPELFWFQNGATYYFDKSTNIVDKIDLQYCMNEDEAKNRKEKIDNSIKSFLNSINNRMSDYEVALKVYENIINLVDYDTIGLEKQKTDTPSNTIPDDLRSIYGVFVNKKAVCAGYAKAMQYLLNLLGIECTYVTSETHAWNLIKLEGDYYHLDVTWGDSSNTSAEKNVSYRIGYDCFCVTTEEILRLESHIPDGDLSLPECVATKCNYHHRNGLFFNSYNENIVKARICERINNGQFDISFKCTNDAVFDKMVSDLLDGGKINEIIYHLNRNAKTKLNTRYMYLNNKERLTLSFEFKKA